MFGCKLMSEVIKMYFASHGKILGKHLEVSKEKPAFSSCCKDTTTSRLIKGFSVLVLKVVGGAKWCRWFCILFLAQHFLLRCGVLLSCRIHFRGPVRYVWRIGSWKERRRSDNGNTKRRCRRRHGSQGRLRYRTQGVQFVDQGIIAVSASMVG